MGGSMRVDERQPILAQTDAYSLHMAYAWRPLLAHNLGCTVSFALAHRSGVRSGLAFPRRDGPPTTPRTKVRR